MSLFKVYCYRIEKVAVVEVEASSHDTACEIALNLVIDDIEDIHFVAPTEGLVDFALKLPLDEIVYTAELPEEAESWPVD